MRRLALWFSDIAAGQRRLTAIDGGMPRARHNPMVVLNKIYTRTGDDGTTGLATGERVQKWSLRVESYGAVDETNAAIGVARLQSASDADLDTMLARIQNDLFDLGADLATPEREKPLGWTPLRIVEAQVRRLETEIDAMNAAIPPLNSFILPGGSALAAHLHVARTICRRAERLIAELSATAGEVVSAPALAYANRLSDFLFVAARRANNNGADDVLWVPGANR
jgi:cob(I)alamin adenosyltransferase